MITAASRPLRADAVRNSERILRAARQAYAELGPDAPLDEIARRAGVGIATLYRRFPNKEGIAKAALDQCIAEQIEPAVARALADDDPRHALATLLDAAVALAAREPHTLSAARAAGAFTPMIATSFFDAMAVLAFRAQRSGQIRADVVPDDLHRILVMLLSLLGTMEPAGEGWQRYVTLVLDGLSPVGATLLPPPVPMS